MTVDERIEDSINSHDPMADALLIGAGGLGVAVARGLVAAGIKDLIVVDADKVALSNLHRQVLYGTDDLNQPKAERLAAALKPLAVDPDGVVIRPWNRRLEGVRQIARAARLARVLVDGSDNFATRFAANDAALITGRPLVHGAAIGLRGQVMTILPGRSACLRCLFGEPPDEEGANCAAEGVLGPVVGEVGWLMALHTMQLLEQMTQDLSDLETSGDPGGYIHTMDYTGMRRRPVRVPPAPGCPCGAESGV